MKTDKRKFIANLISKTGFYILSGLVIVQIVKTFEILSFSIGVVSFLLIMIISIIIYPNV